MNEDKTVRQMIFENTLDEG